MRREEIELLAEKTGEKIGVTAFKLLKENVLTEENTDEVIKWLAGFLGTIKLWKVPLPKFIVNKFVKSFLDQMLPEKILDLLWFLMVKARLVNDEDRP